MKFRFDITTSTGATPALPDANNTKQHEKKQKTDVGTTPENFRMAYRSNRDPHGMRYSEHLRENVPRWKIRTQDITHDNAPKKRHGKYGLC